MPSDAYHHEGALIDPFSIRPGDFFLGNADAAYMVRVIEGGFALVEDLNAAMTVYFDHPRKWVSLGTLAAMQHVTV